MTAAHKILLLITLLTANLAQANPTIDLGEAAEYNAIVFGDFSAESSDVEGQLAVMGDVDINHYSVGDQLPSDPLHNTLISGGDITFPNGQAYHGHILAAGSVAGIGEPVSNGMAPGAVIQGNAALPLDFNQAYSHLTGLSQTLSQMPVNTTFEHQWGGLNLHGDCSSETQVFALDGTQVLDAHTFAVDCIPANAYVVFNISGLAPGLTNMSMDSLASHRERVIYNFYEAQDLTLAGIAVEGTVLAPYADIVNPQGVIKGQLVAQSWDGMMQINHVPFVGQGGAGLGQNQVPTALAQQFDLNVDEPVTFTLTGDDADGDALTYHIGTEPMLGGIEGVAPDLSYTPMSGFTGIEQLTFHVADAESESEAAVIEFRVGQTQCDLYPYTLEQDRLVDVQVGDVVDNYDTSVGNGNYSLLSWTGANDTNTLATSFTMPGDAHLYVNPDDSSDQTIDIGDWVQGAPGKNNANHVRDALDALLGQDITVPVWSQTRGQGSDLDYQVADLARIKLIEYRLNGQPYISFEYLGSADCGNFAPFALDAQISTDQDQAITFLLGDAEDEVNGVQQLLAVIDADQDELSFVIANPPSHGALSGTGPEFTYTPNPGFFGPDSFQFYANDGQVDSNTATIFIEVVQKNQLPVAFGQNVQLNENQLINITLTGQDPDGDPLTFVIESQPSHGQLSGSAPNLSYTPNIDYVGADAFTFSVTDGQNVSAPATIQLEVLAVNTAPIANDLNVVTAENQAVAVDLLGSDPDGDPLIYEIISQPAAGSLSGTAPNLIYTPNNGFDGVDAFSYRVNDGQLDSNIATVSITVTAGNDAPTANDLAVSTDEDTATAITLSGNDPEGDALTFNVLTQPSNGVLFGTAPDLTYTPNANFNGSDAFTYNVNDGSLDSNTATVTLTINPVNDAPVADGQSVAVDEDNALMITLTASDVDGDSLTYVIVTQPSHGSLVGTGDSYTYTPNPDYNGSDGFTYHVNDGTTDSATVSVSITVTAGNDAPTANDLAVSTDEDSAAAITLSGSDPDGDALTFQVLSQPANGTLTGTGDSYTYTPNANFNGSDSFTYSVNDGSLDSNVAAVSISINPVNDAPVADAISLTVEEDGLVSITLSGSDIDGDVLSFVIDSQPSNGTLTGSGDSYTYTPNPDFNGSDGFTYHVYDGTTDSASVSVSITVTAGNDAPTANDLAVSTDEDTATAITLSGSDPEGDALTFNVLTQPSNGVLSGTAPDLTYTPNANFNGSDAFTYNVNDGSLDSNTATVTLTINPVNDAPVADGQSVAVDEDNALMITLTASDVDGDSLTYVIVTQPSHGSLVGTGDSYTYTPNANFNGEDSFEFLANDGTEDATPVTVTITVNAENDAPVANDAAISTDEDVAVNLTLTGSDAEGDALTFSVLTQPANGVLSGTAPDLTYTPNAHFNGSDAFTFGVNDGQNDSTVATIAITIAPINDEPVVEDQTLTTAEDTALAIDVTGSDADGDSLTYQLITAPANGSFSGDMPLITYQPNEHFNGQDSFEIEVHDGQGGVDTATIQIEVTAENDAPTAEDVAISTPYNTAVELPLMGADVEDATVTFQIVDQPSHGQITENAGVFTYTPDSGFFGADSATFHAVDSEGLTSATHSIDITVEENDNQPPVITSEAVTTGSQSHYSYDVEASDPEGSTLTFALTSEPAGASIDPVSGLISWDPSAEYSPGLDTANPQCEMPAEIVNGNNNAEILFYIDGSGSMYQSHAFIPLWLPLLDGELRGLGIGQQTENRYGFALWANILKSIPVSGTELWGNVNELIAATIPWTNQASGLGTTENFVETVQLALDEYSFTPGASKTILFMTDERCAPCDQSLNETNIMLERLLAEDITLHGVIADFPDILPAFNIVCEDGRQAMGVDGQGNGYVAASNGGYGTCSNASFVGLSDNTMTHHVAPTFATGGTIWHIDYINNSPSVQASISAAMSDVIGQSILESISGPPQADLFVQSYDVDAVNSQLDLVIGNRGLSDASTYEVNLLVDQAVHSTQAFTALAVAAEQALVFDLTGLDPNQLALSITSTEPEQECDVTNNTLSLGHFTVQAADPEGLFDEQSFFVNIAETNVAPAISAVPTAAATAGVPYAELVTATDENRGDQLTFALIQGGHLAQIDAISGAFTALPTADMNGFEFIVRVTDLAGLSDEQSFTLAVSGDYFAPVITSPALRVAQAGTTYQYQSTVNSHPTAVLTYELLFGPADLGIDQNGLISWPVPATLVDELYAVSFRVMDQYGNVDTQAYVAAIDEDLAQPPVQTYENENRLIGETQDYQNGMEFRDENAIETFDFVIERGPAGITTRYTEYSVPNFTSYFKTQMYWPDATTQIPEENVYPNYWCGDGSNDWNNLAYSKVTTIDLGDQVTNKLKPNFVAAALRDSNSDGQIDQLDDQVLVYAAQAGIQVLNGNDFSEQWLYPGLNTPVVSLSGGQINALAVADLNNDLSRDVLVMADDRYVYALDADGQLLWQSVDQIADGGMYRSTLQTVDLDADGTLEILAGDLVLNADGSTRFILPTPNSLGFRNQFDVAVVDSNADGLLEILYDDFLYAHDGSLMLDGLGVFGNHFVVLQADADPNEEWIQVDDLNNRISLFDHDGTMLWQTVIANPTRPIAADIDFDGELEIVFANAALNLDGSIIYNHNGSSANEARLTDLNHDGAFELITNESTILEIRDPLTYEMIIPSWTITGLYDQYFVADLDSDGVASLYVPTHVNGRDYLDIYESSDGQWQGPNEYTQALRRHPMTFANGDPAQWVQMVDVAEFADNQLLPDIHTEGPQILIDGSEYRISTVLRNLTPSVYTGELTVSFYNDSIDPANLLGTTMVSDLTHGEAKTVTLPDTFQLDFLAPQILVQVTIEAGQTECTLRNNQASSEVVHWTLTDSYDLVTEEAFAIRVGELNLHPRRPANLAPAVALQAYDAPLVSENLPVDEVVYYNLIDGPAGLSVSSTGRIQWVPTIDQVGNHEITVLVQDPWAQSTLFSKGISVTSNSNLPPNISSTPGDQVSVNETYSYDMDATDPEGTTVSYQLITGPSGASIDGVTGVLSWIPNDSQLGDHDFTLRAIDADGVVADQNFTVTVNDVFVNTPPQLDSTPSFLASVNRQYSYQLVVIDDSPVLNYQLLTAPSGMSLDQAGLLLWTPDTEGDFDVLIQVDDGQYFIQQGWTITVVDPGAPLGGEIDLSATTVIINDTVDVSVIPTGNIGTTTVEATLNGQPLALDANFQATVNADTLGDFTVEATITDLYDTVVVSAAYEVIEETTLTPPVVDILSPGDGGIITGFNDISVLVEDDNLASWRLSYRYAEDDPSVVQRITLAEGTDNVPGGVVANWDTSLLMNGIYVLLIEATDDTGLSTNIAHSVFLEGDLKLGHFSIAFEDMNIPVAGIPITITRGYDTRERNRDRAFGKGWSIGFQSLRLQESRIPGLGWYQQIEYFQPPGLPVVFPRYCIEPAGQPLVSVRMPDGSLEKFEVKARVDNPTEYDENKTQCQDYIAPELFGIEFIPQGDTNSTLTSNTGTSGLGVQGGNLVPFAEFDPVDPNVYTLTTLDGTQYLLDQGFNVREIETTTGYTLTFTEDGIEHSGGLAVSFIRDVEGRITRIEKTNGEGVDYGYDANGDLVSFTDLNGNTSTFTYILDHYLEDIIDPRGIRVARNEYDADGRLVAHIDAAGERIEYDNDLVNMTSTITDRRGNPTINAFDNAGNIVAQTNALGETTTYEYNDIYLETAMTNHLGHRTEWTYDAMGNQLTEKDALGRVNTMTYNNKGKLLTQVDPLNQIALTNVYVPDTTVNGTGQLSTVTDALGRVTELHWLTDANGTMANTGYTNANGNRYDITPINGGTNSGLSGDTTDLNGLKTETTYDDNARPLTETQVVTDELGNEVARYTTSYEYNAQGDVITVTNALGHIRRMEYNELDKVSAEVDELGRRTEMTYDDRGNLVQIKYPDLSTEAMIYDAENNLVESTDRAGRITKTIYDALNRVEAVIYPDDTPGDDADNPMMVNSYDEAGRLVAVSDANGHVTTYEFDAAGNNTRVIDALNHATTYAYDALNRRTSSEDALGRVTLIEYDAVDNVTKTTLPDDTASITDNTFMSMSYDDLNRKFQEIDQAGGVTLFEYSDAGQITAVIDDLGQRTEYTYDQRGNKVAQKDANGHVTTWTYDALNRVLSRTLPMGQSESFTYDAVGNQITHVDFNGNLTTYEYDVMNRITKVIYANNTEETRDYDLVGNLIVATNEFGTTTYEYDERDRIILETKPGGEVMTYTYDMEGNKLSTSIQQGALSKTWTYTYDALNRLTHTVDDQGMTEVTEFNSIGLRTRLDHSNGTFSTYDYDAQNRLIGLATYDANVQIINVYTYELTANGLKSIITEDSGRVTAYTYDDLYRLTGENITDATNGNHVAVYDYDPAGNRVFSTINGITTAYTYDDNDRLIESGAITYDYDANGNLTLVNDDGAVTNYTFNHKNELIESSTAGSTYAFEYDPHGIRTASILDGQRTDYLIDHNQTYAQVLLETGVNGQIVYTYGDDLLKQDQNGQLIYMHYDGLGSTRALSDATGQASDSYHYDAYGDVLAQSGSTENNYLYTGEQFDPNLGFYYLRARYMSPEMGRFISMDSYQGAMADPITLNKYLYGNADPINHIDPSGYFSLAEQGTAMRIRNMLAEMNFDVNMTFFDVATDPEGAERNLMLGIVAGGAASAVKLLRFSKSFRRACNSFAEETLISTENGLVYIGDVEIGERVWAFNELTGEISLQKVVHTIAGQDLKSTIDITLESGEVIQSTAGHPIYAKSAGLWNWVNAEDITSEMTLINRLNETVEIYSVSHNEQLISVYNLTVAEGHTYYVTDDEVLVHNANCLIPTGMRLDHIIRGNVNGLGKASGWHSRAGGYTPVGRRIVGRPGTPDANGVYSAKIQIRDSNGNWKDKDFDHTFFPDKWNWQRIKSEINGAYLSNPLSSPGIWTARSPSGVLIRGRIDSNGKITSAYPVLEL